MNTTAKRAPHWALLSPAIGLAVPSLVIFGLEVFVGHINPITSLASITQRQFAEGENLFLIALFGLIPFVALSFACMVAARRLPERRLNCVAIGGLLGILALMVPAHVAIWYPLYGPGHMSSTASIGFIFIPFYCIAALGVGWLVGWIVSRLPNLRSAPPIA